MSSDFGINQVDADNTSAVPAVRSEPGAEAAATSVDELLINSSGQLGDVARLYIAEGMTSPTEMSNAGGAANAGAAWQLLVAIKLIRGDDKEAPTAPSVALGTLRRLRSFLKQHKGLVPMADLERLEGLQAELETITENRDAQTQEDEQLAEAGKKLLNDVGDLVGGVYVYTLPHFLRHPTVADSSRTYFKVGMATGEIRKRVFQQLTGFPEEPLVLRVYQSSTITPIELEKRFHRHLRAAEHIRKSPGRSGTEWFETTVAFLDSAAELMGVTIHASQATTVE